MDILNPQNQEPTFPVAYLVELHFLFGDLDPLLEGDGEVVRSGVHGL